MALCLGENSVPVSFSEFIYCVFMNLSPNLLV